MEPLARDSLCPVVWQARAHTGRAGHAMWQALLKGASSTVFMCLAHHHPQPSPAPSVVDILSLGIYPLNHRDYGSDLWEELDVDLSVISKTT